MLRPKKREGFSELYESALRKDITINCCESGDGDTTPACSHYLGQNQNMTDCNEEGLPSVSASKTCLQLRPVYLPASPGELDLPPPQWRVVIEHYNNPTHSLDVDIGMAIPNCKRFRKESPHSRMRTFSVPVGHVLILRQQYFVIVRNGVKYFPKQVTISGKSYVLHRCEPDPQEIFCYAVPADAEEGEFIFTLQLYANEAFLIKLSDPTQTFVEGFTFPRGFNPFTAFLHGESLWQPPYGEVYHGSQRPVQYGANRAIEYDSLDFDEVAVKIIRHLNVHCGEEHCDYSMHRVGGQSVHQGAPLHHADASRRLESELSTAHMTSFFESQHKELGRNENIAREVEMMEYIYQSLKGEPESRRHFLHCTEFAICSHNLYVVTPYMPIGSLLHYKHRTPTTCNLTENFAKHVMYQLLCALALMHGLHVAHRDVSVENVVFGASEEKLDDILKQLRIAADAHLGIEDFLQLEVKLIDMGQAAHHARSKDSGEAFPGPHDPIQSSFSNSSFLTTSSFDTQTTSESCSTRSDSDLSALSALSPLSTHSRGVLADVALNTPLRTLSASFTDRDCELLLLSKFAVGKGVAMCPEHFQALYEQDPPNSPALEYCGMCVDIWQAGVLMFHIIIGRPPYLYANPPSEADLHSQREWMDCVRRGRLGEWPVRAKSTPSGDTVPLPVQGLVSEDCLDLLQRLLKADPADRLTALQALEHPWFDDYLTQLQLSS